MEAILQGSVTHTITPEGIATIEFFHPLSNSLPGLVLAQFAHTIQQLGTDPTVKVIILRSKGDRTFCGGASFDELSSINDLDTGRVFFMGFANVINAMRQCPKFIIGRVQGKAVGGGVGIASATDYCIATHEASVKLSELAVGIGPFVVGPAVERKMGLAAMSQLAIHATQFMPAQWAYERGLYNELYHTAAEMDTAIQTLATRLAASSPDAMRELKTVLWQGTENWDELLPARAAISGRLILSDFAKQAIAKFKAK